MIQALKLDFNLIYFFRISQRNEEVLRCFNQSEALLNHVLAAYQLKLSTLKEKTHKIIDALLESRWHKIVYFLFSFFCHFPIKLSLFMTIYVSGLEFSAYKEPFEHVSDQLKPTTRAADSLWFLKHSSFYLSYIKFIKLYRE